MKAVNYPLYRRLVGHCDAGHQGTVVEFTGPYEGTVVVPTKGYALGHKSIYWQRHDCPTTWEPVAAPVTKKFVNAIVPVFHATHVTAVLNEAERLGYKHSTDCNTLSNVDDWHKVQAIHLGGDGVIFAYIHFTAPELLSTNVPKLNQAIILKKLRKLRGLDFHLNNPSVSSKDNLSVLAVIPRPKYEVMVPNTVVFAQPTEVAIERAFRRSENYIAAYGQDNFPKCTCLDVDSNTAKTCRMVQAYGGTCGKPFAKLLKATQEDKDKVIEWYKPKEDVPLVQKLVVWSVLAFSKIVSVVKRGVNFLRGIK